MTAGNPLGQLQKEEWPAASPTVFHMGAVSPTLQSLGAREGPQTEVSPVGSNVMNHAYIMKLPPECADTEA